MFKKKEQIMSKLLFLSTAVLGLSSTTLFADGHTQDYSESVLESSSFDADAVSTSD